MPETLQLDRYLTELSDAGHIATGLSGVILSLADSGRDIARLLQRGGANLAGCIKEDNGAGDAQKQLDVIADQMVLSSLEGAPVAWLASEESDEAAVVTPGAPYCVAVDPLDGSSNIETNSPVGTIFSILPTLDGEPAEASFLQSGSEQVAAGFLVYGPQCTLFLTFGRGVDAFTLDPESGAFMLTKRGVEIASETREFAINASNERHWSGAIRSYIGDCRLGRDGPRGKDFNTRWIASMVAEVQRILTRGGIYLYPGDARKGYEQGRLRLTYEANPISWIVEQAGGAATDGTTRILDLKPTSIHQRTPFVFGSAKEVDCVLRYVRGAGLSQSRSALFSERGLFLA